MRYFQIMNAEMKPDLYDGKTCDQVKPQWYAYAEGDKDGDYLDILTLDAKHFEPGTRVIVKEPECPKCFMCASLCKMDDGCDFDWNGWRDNIYS